MKIYNDPTYDILTIKVTKEEFKKAFSSYENLHIFEDEFINLLEQEMKDNDT